MIVAVTGSAGFIGTHVCTLLRSQGHTVIQIDRRHETNPLELRYLRRADLQGAAAVIHLAAHADVRHNWDDHGRDLIWADNVEATRRLLDACVGAGLRSFTFVSTGAAYAPKLSPYAASKLAGEAFCRAYADRCGWALSVVRPAACYGRGYSHGHIADFVKQAEERGHIVSLTAGRRRDGLHVEDCAELLVSFATSAARLNVYARAIEQWGCRDTVELMRVGATWTDTEVGWLGDTPGRIEEERTVVGKRSLRSGVLEALQTLGWES